MSLNQKHSHASNSSQEPTELSGLSFSKPYDEAHVLHALRHYLPSQTPLKDFIHHNSLHAFQKSKFYDALFQASKIFDYQVTLELKDYRKLYGNGRINKNLLEIILIKNKGTEKKSLWLEKLLHTHYNENREARIGQLRKHWKLKYKIDLDSLVQPLLFRILCSYLDQGIALWKFPISQEGFLASLRTLEKNSFTSFFKTKRAKEMLLDESLQLVDLLKLVVGKEKYFELYIYDQQFAHRGWSGMVATLEEQPKTLHDSRIISLKELLHFEMILEWDALEAQFGSNWQALGNTVDFEPEDIFEATKPTEVEEVLRLWQDAFEWSYYDEVLNSLAVANKQLKNISERKSFQALFCIDERECSIRRHIEAVDKKCETFGTPGFFGVEFYFQPQNGKFYDKLCPAPVTPKYLIKEKKGLLERKHDLTYTPKAQTVFSGFLLSFSLGFWTGLQLFLNLFRPKMSPAISNAFIHMDKEAALTIENKNLSDTENNLQIGFTVDEMSLRVEGLLRGIGLIENFSSLVYCIAHGSSSANNPHHGAHDCGACSGRPGSVNSRVIAFMANHSKVREKLKEKGILIPEDTQFVGGLHDTAADEIEFYDLKQLSSENLKQHQENAKKFESALDLNAKERSRRFASINTKNSLSTVRKAIKDRSVSLFEPRPELGHGTNTLCIVGGRVLTKNLFLDRRAFLNSYNYKTDLEGKLLVGIMKPLGPVCGGINLEYYFSRVDNYKLGAGTKLPHNVMGLFGVANSCDGDLRPGLPLQMIEVHDPVRLLIIVEHFPEVVLNTIKSVPEMYEWFINEWVHLVAFHPENSKFYRFEKGDFIEYNPISAKIDTLGDPISQFENAKEMESNHILDATKENLAVYTLN
jgi:uncharacterized protein YbcC (UPF0753/DUF2309 family)